MDRQQARDAILEAVRDALNNAGVLQSNEANELAAAIADGLSASLPQLVEDEIRNWFAGHEARYFHEENRMH